MILLIRYILSTISGVVHILAKNVKTELFLVLFAGILKLHCIKLRPNIITILKFYTKSNVIISSIYIYLTE